MRARASPRPGGILGVRSYCGAATVLPLRAGAVREEGRRGGATGGLPPSGPSLGTEARALRIRCNPLASCRILIQTASKQAHHDMSVPNFHRTLTGSRENTIL